VALIGALSGLNPFSAGGGTKQTVADIQSKKPQGNLSMSTEDQIAQQALLDNKKQEAEMKRQQQVEAFKEQLKATKEKKDTEEALGAFDKAQEGDNPLFKDPTEAKRMRFQIQSGIKLPAEEKLTAGEMKDVYVTLPGGQGAISAVQYNTPQGPKFYGMDGSIINIPKTASISLKEAGAGKLSGVLKEEVDAHNILSNSTATPQEKEAAKFFLKNEDMKARGATMRVAIEGETLREKKEQPSEAQEIAKGIMEGKQPPELTGLGRGGMAAKVRSELEKNGFDLTKAALDYQGTKQWVRTQNSSQQIKLKQATEFATESLDLIDNPSKPGDDLLGQLRGKIPRTQFPVVNKAAISAAKNGLFGEDAAEAARNLDIQIKDLQSEIATVYKGGGTPTDIGLKQAQEILKSDWSEKSLRSAINLSRKNLKIRLNSIKNTGAVGAGGEPIGGSKSSDSTNSDVVLERGPDGKLRVKKQ
jgi:hypothetical protein